MKTLNKVLLAGGVAALLLIQCDWVKADISTLFFPPKVIDFPLGESKTVSYPIDSWAEKSYTISVNAEYINNKKAQDEVPEIPYRLSVKCYRLEKNAEVLFFEDTYVVRDIAYGIGNETRIVRENIFDNGYWWELNNPNMPDAEGKRHRLKEFRLPYGRYRCDFKDESPPEIKVILQEAGIVHTAIEIFPFEPFIY